MTSRTAYDPRAALWLTLSDFRRYYGYGVDTELDSRVRGVDEVECHEDVAVMKLVLRFWTVMER